MRMEFGRRIGRGKGVRGVFKRRKVVKAPSYGLNVPGP